MEGAKFLMKKSSRNSVEVSVIIVNYNTGKLLKECVDSVISSYPQGEVIVIDNNSTDGSADIKGKFQLIKNTSNPGFPKANNQGIKQAKGEYIFLLNPDTKVLDGAIEKLVQFAKDHEDTGVVVPQLLNPDKSVQDSVMPLPTIWKAIQEFWFNKKVYSKYAPNATEPIEVEAAVMAGFLITPKALKQVGLLDEKYFMYYEDLDYCRSVQEAGLKIYYIPSAQIIHYHGVSGKNLSDTQNQWKRLVPSSKIYHGLVVHHLLFIIAWTSQKFKRIF